MLPQGQAVQTSTTSSACHCSRKTEMPGLYCCYPLGHHKAVNYSEVQEKQLLFSSEDKLLISTWLLPAEVSKLCAAPSEHKLGMRDSPPASEVTCPQRGSNREQRMIGPSYSKQSKPSRSRYFFFLNSFLVKCQTKPLKELADQCSSKGKKTMEKCQCIGRQMLQTEGVCPVPAASCSLTPPASCSCMSSALQSL